jgi:hypothetical protein
LTTSGVFSVKSMYLDFMNDNVRFLCKYIWKIKVPLKIRIFMWFLHKKVLLTKDNLAKRNWQGNKRCCFCDKDETIQHLFIACPFAKIVWRIVYMAFNICPPANITNLFGNWLGGVPKYDKVQIRVGVCALLWAIWNTRNDYIFNNAKSNSFMKVIPKDTHWICLWSFLLPMERQQALDIGCNRLERVSRDLYNQCS